MASALNESALEIVVEVQCQAELLSPLLQQDTFHVNKSLLYPSLHKI